ncbi:cobalamin biosynthesis protein [Rhabdothermincola sediminis]|uniref:cobalamin biosynthesis protein n=1 Tax=Rhabdothermincola sediminis TaxID=2751370 RepID=UPI001AA04D04|nr:cobalamin biosynthesis protein [Rhabdothermincola sediminis]
MIVGIGLASRASAEEVEQLVRDLLSRHGLPFPPGAIATRTRFATDPRVALGCPVVGIDDDELLAASPPVSRRRGLPAQVARTAALLAAGPGGRLLEPAGRSRYATAAVARPAQGRPAPRHRSERER